MSIYNVISESFLQLNIMILNGLIYADCKLKVKNEGGLFFK